MGFHRHGHVRALPWTATVLLMSVVLLSLAKMHTVRGDYVLKVELNQYLSTMHTKVDGFCCEPTDCTVECDNRFLFCLQSSDQPAADTSCPLGNYTTGNISRDNATFTVGEPLDEGVPNPMLFQGASWPGSVKLYVEVNEVNPPTSQGSNSESSLVAQFDIAVDLDLGYNRTAWVDRTARYSDRKFDGTFLYLTIELSCEDHFYGPGCDRLCEPRDDERGHYMCDNSGNIICLEGFQNEVLNCTECSLSSECFSKGGFCNDTHHCICREGYDGQNCEIDLDSCSHLEPCLNGASCVNTNPNSYECICAAGYEGEDCAMETDECSATMCQNGGTCQDLHLDFVCTCAVGFTGRHCETDVNECASNPCLNGGACQDGRGEYQCDCADGFTGKDCEENQNAVAFVAIVGGGAAGCVLLILIALVLLVILIWIAKQLQKEKVIAAEGDLRGKEERISADNPMFHKHEEAVEMNVIREEKETIGQDRTVSQNHNGYSETENTLVNGAEGYSRLDHGRMNSQSEPRHLQLQCFIETEAEPYPHYSSLNLNETDPEDVSGHTQTRNPRDHQYEDIDEDSIENKRENKLDKNALPANRCCYDDVIIVPSRPTPRRLPENGGADELVKTGSERYDMVDGIRDQEIVEIEKEVEFEKPKGLESAVGESR